MSVTVNIQGKTALFDIVEEGAETGEFFLEDDSNRRLCFKTPLRLDSSFHGKDFEVHFLIKKNGRESEIYQVFSNDLNKRIGWLMPISSIDSAEHDYSEDEHFLKYAYMGITQALKQLNPSLYSKEIDGGLLEFSCADVFHDDTVLLVLSRETFTDGYSFDINRATPSLISHGYVCLGVRNPDEVIHQTEYCEKTKIVIEEIASGIENLSLISGLMNSSFAFEPNPIFRFFYLYQIIELLIDYVYQNEQERIVQDLVNSKGDSGKTKEALKELQEFMSEKNRIKLLVNSYSNIAADIGDLRDVCHQFLNTIGREQKNNFEDFFYRIRNFIFHQYRDFPDTSLQILEDVLDETISIMPKLLNRYRAPVGHVGGD